MELECPHFLMLNTVRSVLSHICVRGLTHVQVEDLLKLRTAAGFFRQCEAMHMADHIEGFLVAREKEPETASRQLLELQSRVLLFERHLSRQKAIDQLC